MKKHNYNWKKVIIGSTLEALIQAYKTNSHIIINNVDNLFLFDTIGDYEDLVLNNSDITTKYDMRNYISYDLARKGLNPLGMQVASVKINEGRITVMTSSNQKTVIQADDIIIYSLENVSGLSLPADEIEGFRVFDWFNVRRGMNHEYDIYERESSFCNKFYFYLSKRIDGNKKYKDLVVESYLSKKQVKDPDYSDAVSRLIAKRVMKELGIHASVKLETFKRELVPIRKKIYYELSFGRDHSCQRTTA